MTDRVDISGVELDPGLLDLREVLAAHVHDAWVELRMADGWAYGAVRDDDLKQHPCLVSYEALPDSDKAYDREIAMATLKAVLALGYAITRLEGD
ncbi:MAG: RyR domain-containing protein [Vicinamibacterales bacterium]